MKHSILLLFLLFHSFIYGQDKVANRKFFHDFLNGNGKRLLILGENHSSSAASTIYPQLIRYLNRKNDVKTLLIEFGPSEAYFYRRYLETGDEKFLNYTIYAGYYKDWKEAWQEIYRYNQTLKEPLKIVGIDFDRTRTFAYALYNIFSHYKKRPGPIDSLMNVIRDKSFFKTYTIGYPTERDKQFVASAKKILDRNKPEIEKLLKPGDMTVISRMLQNKATDYNDARDQDICANIAKYIEKSGESSFFMLIGREHAYVKSIISDQLRLAALLKNEPAFTTLTGVILHEDSRLWGKDYKKEITLHEVKDKVPWKDFYPEIMKKVKGDFTVIPLKKDLAPLAVCTDYIITALHQPPVRF